ncbi:MAG: DUF4058 family protein [Pirellulales bacterium]
MNSPFPGMDPYLEQPGVWPDFHSEFIGCLRYQLRQRLPANYDARINERIALFDMEGELVQTFVPDTFVIEKQNGGGRVAGERSMAVLEPVTLPLVIVHESRETYIEIYHRPERSLIGIVEVLSPTNKRGEGRGEYLAKRNCVLCQPVHLVEFDLLIAGERLPLAEPLPLADYYAFVSRSDQRPYCQVYPWRLRQALPAVNIPLRPGDADVCLDLASVFEETYRRGGYENDLDYTSRPLAPLDPADLKWAMELAQSFASK